MRIVRVAPITIAAFVASSCTLSDVVEVYNNSGTGIMLMTCERNERVGDGLSVELYSWCQKPIKIESSRGVWMYRALANRDFIRQYGAQTKVGNFRLKLQLQSDGSIVLVPPQRSYPDKSDQPDGFPILPDSRNRLAFSTVNDALGARPDWQLAATAPPEVSGAITFGRRAAERTG